jgi:N-acetylmuramoyl-L-alanine amidase
VSARIFLSAGHSETDPGAIAFGVREADVAVEMRNMVSFYLHDLGVLHGVDGTGTTNIPLSQATKLARGFDISLEFHCNASENSGAGGVETLQGEKDRALGDALCTAIASTMGIRNRGAKPENAGQHHRLAFVQAGGVIVELFFLTNPKELKRWRERKWVVARAVAGVLAEQKRREKAVSR